MVCSGSLAVLSVIGILYFVKKLKASRSKAAEDRKNFIHLFIPVLLMSAFGLWLLFFKNPFKSGSVKNRASFVQSVLSTGSSLGTGGGGAGSRILWGAAESIAGSAATGGNGLGKKFFLGFVCGLTSIMALRNRNTTNHFVKAFVL